MQLWTTTQPILKSLTGESCFFFYFSVCHTAHNTDLQAWRSMLQKTTNTLEQIIKICISHVRYDCSRPHTVHSTPDHLTSDIYHYLKSNIRLDVYNLYIIHHAPYKYLMLFNLSWLIGESGQKHWNAHFVSVSDLAVPWG